MTNRSTREIIDRAERERDDWSADNRAKQRAINDALPTLVDRKPIAESNQPGAHYFRTEKVRP